MGRTQRRHGRRASHPPYRPGHRRGRWRQTHIAVVGDLNDTPDSDPLSPLLAETNLRDISEHPHYQSDGRPGTYANGTKSNKIDYVLLCPETFGKITGGRIFRKGVWGGVHGTLFPHYPTMTKAAHAASDRAAIFADVQL